MKKLILLSFLSLPLFFLAQIKQQQSPEQLKEKEFEIKNKRNGKIPENKHNVYVSREEYAELKRNGLVTNQRVLKTAGPKIKIIPPNYSGNKTLASTPCDNIPYVGNAMSFSNYTLFQDDGTESISLPFDFCFYGNVYNSCNISINGNIQFVSNDDGYTATGFPSNSVDMIAPFWADIDLNGMGQVLVDMSVPTRVVISWDSVGRYDALTDKYNSFQCIITDGFDPVLPPGKNVGFYYKKMQWTNSGTLGFNGNASTVGINAGNNIDYFLIGKFNQPGNIYDGPLGNNDGVSWLDGKRFYFNACPPLGSNIEPISTLIGYCDTLQVCGNDTLLIKNSFIGPELTQSVTITATAASLGSAFTYSVLSNSGSSEINMIINGGLATGGYHTITMTATDNGTPALTSTQDFVVYVNQLALNNLNASIAITPTLGACLGGAVTANVIVSGGSPSGYLWSNNSVLSSTTYTMVVPADSLIFVTITSGQCQKTIIGDITIHPEPIASISGNLSFCNANALTTVLTATNTLNPSTQGPHTFNWAGTGTLSATNTESPTVNAGVYTVTVTNQFGCTSIATTTVVMNDSPKFSLTNVNAIPGGSVYCVGTDSAKVAINFGTSSSSSCGLANSPCVVSNTFQVGTGNTNGTSSTVNPFVSFWESSHHQYLYKASELIAAGVKSGKLSSIGINLATLSSETFYPGFTVKIKCTSVNALTSSFDNSGLSLVYQANTTINLGLNTLNFSQPYLWDGTSNILIDICHDETSGIPSNSQSVCSITPFVSVLGDYASGSGSLCGSTTGGSTSSTRPNIKFGNCLAQQTGSQFDVVITPTTAVVNAAHDSISFLLPTTAATVCYTVSLNNPIGNCTKDTVICFQTIQGVTNATLVSTQSVVCIGSPITLSASGSLSTYTIQYNNGAGVISSTTAVTFNTAVGGTNTYTLLAKGFCNGPINQYTASVLVNNLVTLSITLMPNVTKCLNSSVTLTANVAASTAAPYTYNWLPAIGTSTNSTYISSTVVTTTYVVTVNGTCANTATSSVVVSNYDSNVNVLIIDSASVCASKELVLHTLTTGGKSPFSYSWTILPDVNSISSSSDLNTTAPSTEGTYTVMVVNTDDCGFTDFDTQLITVLPPCGIEIGNIITPNGDGVNDFFKIKSMEYHPNSLLTIFDRWGRKVYENQNYANEWNASGLNDGTYFYTLEVPEDKKYNGFVQVLR